MDRDCHGCLQPPGLLQSYAEAASVLSRFLRCMNWLLRQLHTDGPNLKARAQLIPGWTCARSRKIHWRSGASDTGPHEHLCNPAS